MNKRKLENAIFRNMILRNKKHEHIQKKIPKDLYNSMLNRKRRVIDEDHKIRKNMTRKLCKVNIDDDIISMMNGINPLLRNKRRAFLLMGGNYEEVIKEIE